MKTIINKKLASLNRTTKTVGDLKKLKQLKDKQLNGVAGGKGKLNTNRKRCTV